MAAQNPKEKPQSESPSREGLIEREWDVINELQKMLKDPDLTVNERLHAANVLAFHMNSLNRMLTRKGNKEEFEDQNLGDYIRGVEPRIARTFRRDFRVWKRTLSYRRY
jgi:aspartate-semialdehyde dehydrogenase